MKGLTLIVKTITDFVVAFIVIFGAYIVLYGHLTPGGGFAGGVIVACAFILLMLAQGKEVAFSRLGERTAHVLDSAGALAFLVIGWVGLTGGFFFMNVFGRGDQFRLLSSGMILPANIAIAFKVGTSLFLVFSALAVFRRRSFRSMIEDELS
ncbi:MAG: MnhB domain-containing protein [Candidatus Eisenbacteria bacterium]